MGQLKETILACVAIILGVITAIAVLSIDNKLILFCILTCFFSFTYLGLGITFNKN